MHKTCPSHAQAVPLTGSPAQTTCATCGKPKEQGSPDTWFFVAWPAGSRYLCSRICLIKWISGDGRVETLVKLKTGGYHIITPEPHRRE